MLQKSIHQSSLKNLKERSIGTISDSGFGIWEGQIFIEKFRGVGVSLDSNHNKFESYQNA